MIFSNEGNNSAPDTLITDTLPLNACYVPGSTFVTNTGWILPEPTVTGICGSGQILVWDNILDGTSVHPELSIGAMPANSEDVYITYEARVGVSVGLNESIQNTVTVETSILEDPIHLNTADEEVFTSIPDPEVNKNVVPSVIPGQTFSYDINYSNTERTDATNVYILDTLPDLNGTDGAEITILSATDSAGLVTTYYHAYSASTPGFTSGAPSGGWTTDLVSLGGNVGYIAFDFGVLPALTTGTINVSAQVIDPLPTPTNLLAGISLTNSVEIFADIDGNPANNTDTAITQTPGFDLVIEKTGSIEGVFPGALPGDLLVYTIDFSNIGTEAAC